KGTSMKGRHRSLIGLLAVVALAVTACGSGEASGGDTEGAAADNEPATTSAETEASSSGYEVYALLPQGNDQPYGTTYLPPLEEKAAELGITLTITNSQYDADKQASECEVAVAAQPDLIILWPAVGDTVRPCLEAANDAGIPVTVRSEEHTSELQSRENLVCRL